MKHIFILLTFLTLSACNSELTVMGSQSAANSGEPEIFALNRLQASPGDLVRVSGLNLTSGMIVQIGDSRVPLKVSSRGSASFVMPAIEGTGPIGATFLSKDSQSLATLALVNDGATVKIPVMDVDPGAVCSDITYQDSEGHMKMGLRNCLAGLPVCTEAGQTSCTSSPSFPAVNRNALNEQRHKLRATSTIAGIQGILADCSSDGATDCVAVSDFPAIDKLLKLSAPNAANIRRALTIAGVSGTLADCLTDNESGCVTDSAHPAVVKSTITAGMIKAGSVIAGVTGNYPSATYPLSSNTVATDLTLFATQLTTNGSFEFFDSTGARYTGSGDSDLSAANVRSGTAIEGLSISGTMPAVLPTAPTPLTTSYLTTPNRVALSWANTGAAGYLVVARAGAATSFNPTRSSTYTPGAQGSDTILYVGAATTYTHTGVTPSTNYYYAVYSHDANAFYSLAAATATNGAISCGGLAGGTWVLVPGDAAYGTSDFCVMKYEAKDVASVATSQAALSPWVNISQTAAISTCQALGAGYSLISNADWLTIGVNIASEASNWSTGTVGSGAINRGHSDNNPGAGCVASADDTLGWVHTDCTARNSSGDVWNQKRTHTLSNGSVVWDFAGNVWDWTSYVIPNNSAKPYGSADGLPVHGWREFTTLDSGFSSMTRGELTPTHAQKSFWNDSWASSVYGMGQYYSAPNGSGGAIRRGNAWDAGTYVGLFAAALNYAPSDGDSALGFRCVFR